jgi:hypothetical protein
MEPILVPAPPKSAFNKNRAPSDLLVSQVRHFQHVEHKSGIAIDAAMARDVQTEAGAARYILEVTRAIRRQSAKPTGIAMVPPRKPGDAISAPVVSEGLTIAAAGEEAAAPKPSKPSKRNKRKKP